MTSTEPSTNAQTLASFRNSGFGEPGSPMTDIDRRRALEGVVSVEENGKAARVPSMYGDILTVGQVVHHATLQWATARVVDFEIDDSGQFRYPWVKVIVEHIDYRGQTTDKVDMTNNRWDWDRTSLGCSIL